MMGNEIVNCEADTALLDNVIGFVGVMCGGNEIMIDLRLVLSLLNCSSVSLMLEISKGKAQALKRYRGESGTRRRGLSGHCDVFYHRCLGRLGFWLVHDAIT